MRRTILHTMGFSIIPRVLGHVLEDNSDLPLLSLRAGSGNRPHTDTNVGWQRLRWKRRRISERAQLEGPAGVPGDAEHYR